MKIIIQSPRSKFALDVCILSELLLNNLIATGPDTVNWLLFRLEVNALL